MKILRFLAPLLLLCAPAFSQAVWYGSVAQSLNFANGIQVEQPLPGASILVCTYGSTCDVGHMAVIYTDNTAVTTAANPVTADNQGNFGFWALPGNYQYSITYRGSVSGPYTVSVSIVDTAKKLNKLRYADQYGSIQAAINDLGGAGSVYVPCGTYVENITISNGGQRIIGQAQACVHIQPAVLSSPVITYASTSSGGNGLNYDGLEEVSIECPIGQTCSSDGLRFTGTDPNDRHTFKNVTITGLGGFNTGFQNGINIQGRMIWTTFDHVEVRYSRGDGLHAVTSAVINHVDFRSSQFDNSQNYGINFQNSNATPSLDINFYHLNVEYNGASTLTNPCSGLFISGIGSGGIYGGYFENNCSGNVNANTAEVRITGTFAQSFNIIGVVFAAADAINFWDIYNDAVQTTGLYEGNRNAAGKGIGIATQHVLSSVTVGANFNFNVVITPDANASTHANMIFPIAFDMTGISTVTSNTIDASLSNNIQIFSGPYTINTITGGHRGQLLLIRAVTQAMTFNHLIGNIVIQGGLPRVVKPTETIEFVFDGTNWVQTGFDASQVPGALTVTGLTTMNGNAKVGTNGTSYAQDLNCAGAITPASVNATTCAEQTFTIGACSGLATTDTLFVKQSAANTTLAFPVGDWRVSSAGVIARTYCNPTAGALTPTAQTLTIWARH